MSVINATDADFNDVIAAATASGKPVLVDFWATWCGPCRQIAPVVEAIAAENPEFTVVKVDVDQAGATAQANRVMSVPTLLVIDSNGQPVRQFTGPQPKPALVTALAEAA